MGSREEDLDGAAMSDFSECVGLAKYFLGVKASPAQVERLAHCIEDRIVDELQRQADQPVEQRSDGRWEK
jgi:hypothetical protein